VNIKIPETKFSMVDCIANQRLSDIPHIIKLASNPTTSKVIKIAKINNIIKRILPTNLLFLCAYVSVALPMILA
jgi:hypothetical protein